jgi:hypothetical protein
MVTDDRFKRELLRQIRCNPDYPAFVSRFLAQAAEVPQSPAGILLAKTVFNENMVDEIDRLQSSEKQEDADFLYYRLDKQFFREQRQVFEDKKRYISVVCSRRSGKTEMASGLIDRVSIHPGSPILYIGSTLGNAKNQVYQKTIDHANAAGLAIDKESSVNGSIKFSNGSSLVMGGNSDNAQADKYRGGKYRLIIIDEAGHQRNMPYLVNEVLEPMLLDYPDSRIVLMGTPSRIPNTFFEQVCNNQEWSHYHWTMENNPYIKNAVEEVERIAASKGIKTDDPLILREYKGLWVYDTEALVFKGRRTENVDAMNLPFVPDHITIGNDYGWSANNAVIALAYDTKSRKSVTVSESMFNHCGVTDVVNANKLCLELCTAMASKYGILKSNIKIVGDTSDTQIIYDMVYRYNLPAQQCYKYDKAEAIASLAEELRTGRMTIQKDGILDTEMKRIIYKRDEKDNILPEIDEEAGIHPDASMALLYASRQMFYDYGMEIGGEGKQV